MDTLSGLGWFLSAIAIALAGAAMVIRLRAAAGAARQQLKWIAFAASLAGIVFLLNWISWMAAIAVDEQLRMAILGLAFAGFPVAAGIAILRYRLYDIDVAINRALVYGALTATLAGTYLGGVLLLQLVLSPLTSGGGLAVAGSTLATAALFAPARARIQAGLTAASSAASTTPSARWRPSARGCASRSTSTPSAASCAPSSATRCSPRTSRCGCAGGDRWLPGRGS